MNITALLRILLLLVVALVCPAQAEPVASQRDTVSLSLNNTKLSGVMKLLSRQKRINILLSSGVEGRVTVDIYDMDVDSAIKYIANAAGFAAAFRDGAYFITTHDEIGRSEANGLTELRVFKVQYNNPTNVSENLTTHLSRYGKITTLQKRNLLVVEDQPEKLDQLASIIAKLDQEPRQILIER